MTTADDIIQLTNKRIGADVLKPASRLHMKRVRTGLLSLDEHTEGGLPMGVPISVAGKKSVGKSAFCYHMCGQAEKQYGGAGCLIQTEGGFVPYWAEKCGLPPCDFVPVFEATKLGQTLELVLNILRESKPTWVLLDSLSMLSADPDKSVVDSKSRGERAIPTNNFFRNIMSAMSTEHPPLFLYIEHLHPDVSSPYGGLITTGGETKGYANVMEIRLMLDQFDKRDIETGMGKQELPVTQKVQWEIRKSKASPTRGRGCYTLGLRDTEWSRAGEISDFDEVLARAINLGHVKKAGAWFTIGDEKYQGAEKLKGQFGYDALKELALKPREEARAEDGPATRLKGSARKRGRKLEGRSGGGEADGAGIVSGGNEVNDGQADSLEVRVDGEDQKAST